MISVYLIFTKLLITLKYIATYSWDTFVTECDTAHFLKKYVFLFSSIYLEDFKQLALFKNVFEKVLWREYGNRQKTVRRQMTRKGLSESDDSRNVAGKLTLWNNI